MGCGSSKGSVVPLEARTSNGRATSTQPAGGANARVPGSGQSRSTSRGPSRGAASRRASEAPAIEGRDPPEEDLPKELPELRELVRAAGGKSMAFEVPLSDAKPDAEAASRRPPRRLQRLEDPPLPPSQRLTHRLLDERQEAADERRTQILSQRVQSAQQRVPKRRGRDSDADGGLNSSGSFADSLADSRGSRNGELLEMLNNANRQRAPHA